MSARRILVIDDDSSILSALHSMLTMSGYDVMTISEVGQSLQNGVNNFHPEVIILDVMLSGEDGRIVCQKLKSDKNTANIPIVMISAHPNVKEASLAAGAYAFLAKPFDMHELLDVVENAFHT